MTINFYLKEPSSKNPTLIYLVIYYRNIRFKFSTGEKIIPLFWDFKNQRVLSTHKESSDINLIIEKVAEVSQHIYRNSKINGADVSNDYLRRELNTALNWRRKCIDCGMAFLANRKNFPKKNGKLGGRCRSCANAYNKMLIEKHAKKYMDSDKYVLMIHPWMKEHPKELLESAKVIIKSKRLIHKLTQK